MQVQSRRQRRSTDRPSERPAFAQRLRAWRGVRKLSQLELAVNSEISQRHLSFLESGRARPSRVMVLQLAEALDLPLRERNLMLASAGFAPVFAARALDDPEMRPVLDAVRMILDHHEPNPAVVLDGCWNVVMENRAMTRLFGLMGDIDAAWQRCCGDGSRNLLKLTFHPEGMRAFMQDWEGVCALLLSRLRREVDTTGRPGERALLAEILNYPGLPEAVLSVDPEVAPSPVIPLTLGAGGVSLSLFSMISTFGTAQDVTTDELRIESFFPADEASAALLKMMAAG
jgi:transcriptional regulator with XRE-family HTH domain